MDPDLDAPGPPVGSRRENAVGRAVEGTLAPESSLLQTENVAAGIAMSEDVVGEKHFPTSTHACGNGPVVLVRIHGTAVPRNDADGTGPLKRVVSLNTSLIRD